MDRKSGILAGEETEIPAPQMTVMRLAPATASHTLARSRLAFVDFLAKDGIRTSLGTSYGIAAGSSGRLGVFEGLLIDFEPTGISTTGCRCFRLLRVRRLSELIVEGGVDVNLLLSDELIEWVGVDEREEDASMAGC